MSNSPSSLSQQQARYRQRQIGKGLGLLYASLVREQLPAGLLQLLAEADLAQQRRCSPALPSMTPHSSLNLSL